MGDKPMMLPTSVRLDIRFEPGAPAPAVHFLECQICYCVVEYKNQHNHIQYHRGDSNE